MGAGADPAIPRAAGRRLSRTDRAAASRAHRRLPFEGTGYRRPVLRFDELVTPRLRMDLQSTARWRPDLGAAWSRLTGLVTQPVAADPATYAHRQ